MLSKRLLLILATAFAPIAWGSTYAVTTEFLPAGAPMLTSLLRALPAGLILLAITRTLPRGEWWWKAAVLGILNVGAFFPLLFIGAYRLPGGVAATVGAIQPLLVLTIAHLALKEGARRIQVAAGVAGVVGVALLVLTPSARLDGLGLVAAIGGAVLMAAGVTLTKAWGPAVPPLTLTAWQLTAGGIVLIPIAAIEGLPDAPVTWAGVAGYAWIGLVGTVVAYSLWFRGLAYLPAAAVSFLSLLTSVSAATIGWLWLHQSLNPVQLVGLFIALAAVASGGLLAQGSRAKAPRLAEEPLPTPSRIG